MALAFPFYEQTKIFDGSVVVEIVDLDVALQPIIDLIDQFYGQ